MNKEVNVCDINLKNEIVLFLNSKNVDAYKLSATISIILVELLAKSPFTGSQINQIFETLEELIKEERKDLKEDKIHD